MVHVLLILQMAFFVHGQSKVEVEFKMREQRHRQKVEDFYTRLNNLDRTEERRRLSEVTQRESRKKLALEYEKKRLAFVQQRRNRPPIDPSLWEAEQKRKALTYESHRQAYVRERDKLNSLMQSVGKLSEEEEYDLFLYEVGEDE